MTIPNSIASLFCAQGGSLIESAETFNDARWVFRIAQWRLPEVNSLVSVVGQIPTRDRLAISVSFDGVSLPLPGLDQSEIEDFIAECATYFKSTESNSSILIELRIHKVIVDATASLYSAKTLIETAQTRTLAETYELFAPLLINDRTTKIQLFDCSEPFSTKTLDFYNGYVPLARPYSRGLLTSRRMEFCHCENLPVLCTPDDFTIEGESSGTALAEILNPLSVITSIIYIADISSFLGEADDARLAFRLNGYKVISGSIARAGHYNHAVHELWHIYDWIYSGGSISDKLGLARNIISLHWIESVNSLVESGAFASIRSGYEIYLKSNVRQYIDVMNRLSEFLSEYSQKASRLADGLCDKMEKNIAAFVGFFITTVIAKLVTDKNFTGILTLPLACLGLTIIGFSLIHLLVSVVILNKDQQKLGDDRSALKRRYSDVLDRGDLDRIFDASHGWNSTNNYLLFKKRIYISLWSFALICFFILVLAFTSWRPASSLGTSPNNQARTNTTLTSRAVSVLRPYTALQPATNAISAAPTGSLVTALSAIDAISHIDNPTNSATIPTNSFSASSNATSLDSSPAIVDQIPSTLNAPASAPLSLTSSPSQSQ